MMGAQVLDHALLPPPSPGGRGQIVWTWHLTPHGPGYGKTGLISRSEITSLTPGMVCAM